MPCYCDIPDEHDQDEIQRRCKENMYFDAVSIKFIELKDKNKKYPYPKNVDQSLCRICKELSKEQMMKVLSLYFQIKWPYATLLDWYVDHLRNDIKNNIPSDESYIQAIKEIERLGLIF